MKCVLSLWLSVCGLLLAASGSVAQSIVGQEMTIVTPVGDQLNITGGVTSARNVFHSFSEFGLSSTQTANFEVPAGSVSAGSIRNVISRVTGGNPSVINGVMQTSGGIAPNFYLMNPAGIVFGPNFSLNIPGAFTATTANGIGFGSNWFSATGGNDYPSLIGDPRTFGFTMAQPAAIINRKTGNFNQSVTLLAGTVVSSADLKLNSGQLTIEAVPGNRLVRIISDGNLLRFEIRPFQTAETQPNSVAAAIPSLAQLITGPSLDGGTVGDATGVSVNPDGTLTLTGAGMSIRPGDVQTAALQGDGVLVNASGNVIVDTIESRDLGVDITAGQVFQATKTFGPTEYRSLFQELLPTPGSDLMAFLQLKTGLSEADILSKYPGAPAPRTYFPTMASIFVRRGIMSGTANVVIRHGGGSRLDLQGRSGTTVTGTAPFSLGGNVTLDSPDLANRYGFVDSTQTFANLAASMPGGAIESQDPGFDLRRNQSTTAIPIPANSSGTVGAIVQTVRGDGGLTIAFGDRVFGSLPPATPPVAPLATGAPPASPTEPITSTATTPNGSGAIASVQQAGERGSAMNHQCESTVSQSGRGKVASVAARTATVVKTDCPAIDDDDTAILKILE
jgi:filamentous hemagglutinin family protein